MRVIRRVQVLGAIFRPPPDGKLRWAFEKIHTWWGRFTVLSAWVNIYLGIWLYHKGVYAAELRIWLVPVSTVLVSIIILDLLLSITSWYRHRKGFEPHFTNVKQVSGSSNDNLHNRSPSFRMGMDRDIYERDSKLSARASSTLPRVPIIEHARYV